MVGETLFRHRQQPLPVVLAILLVLGIVALPLPWLRGLLYKKRFEELLARPELSGESRQILEEAVENISVILVLSIKAPLICFIVIIALINSHFG
jgi:hypothetical protein